MKSNKFLFFLLLLISAAKLNLVAQSASPLYPSYKNRQISPGNTNYYIDPQSGDDNNSGVDQNKPWKTFKRINQLVLSANDKLEVLSAGTFTESLVLMAQGTPSAPVSVKFAAGRYDIFPYHALKLPLHISNTNDQPYEPKAIALMFDSCQFIKIKGGDAKFVMRGKMIETYINNCTNITLEGLRFDYERPTVSELIVTEAADDYADLQIHKDSKFSIQDSLLIWEGEGWSHISSSYWQVLNGQSNYLSRINIPMKEMRFISLGGNEVRAYFPSKVKNKVFAKGYIYQTRNVERDCAGIFMQRSKDIALNNIRIYFMHGMGVVSQYCENIRISYLQVRPASTSGRTCAAWADILHFSGCKGLIDIGNSYLSAANDDAINIHGTHLIIKKIEGPNQLRIAFMNKQTYGFDPFAAGDSLDFIRPKTLLSLGNNVVLQTGRLNDKEVLLTLKMPLPDRLKIKDAVENITATPQVWIHDNIMEKIPTRGILVTSRRKILIEHNSFIRTAMSGVLVSDDASSWYESGIVKNLTIQHNNFDQCGGPVIAILPENKRTKRFPVHSNIAIRSNTFDLRGPKLFSARSTANISIDDNVIITQKPVRKIEKLIKLKRCKSIKMNDNRITFHETDYGMGVSVIPRKKEWPPYLDLSKMSILGLNGS